tara:strand:+ start:374 stop:655 length:282 start_codon:yes stop_codon:yes gene_type:complete
MNKQLSNDKVVTSSFDGFPRHKTAEETISLNMHALFNSPTGKEVLRYLRSITIEAVHGSAVTDEVLRHAEGSRYIVGIIERRVVHGDKVAREE